MANKRISDLAVATTLSTADVFMITQGGVSKRLSFGEAAELLNTGRVLISYSVKSQNSTAFSGTESIDYDLGNVVNATITGNVTSLTVTNWPTANEGKLTLYITQANGGGHLVSDWGLVNKWIGGTLPVLSTALNATDIIMITSPNGSTLRIGSHVGTATT